MLKAVIFDLDNTLIWDEKSVDVSLRATCSLASELSDIDAGELNKTVREVASELFASFDTYEYANMIGISPFEGLWAESHKESEEFQLPGITSTYKRQVWETALEKLEVDNPQLAEQLAWTFKNERKNKPYVYTETFDVLDKLYGYPLLMLTNGLPGLQKTKINMIPDLKKYFQHIVISGEFGKGKPDPAIFEHALELLSVQRDEVLVVGDNLYTDIKGAMETGMLSVWINYHDIKAPDQQQPTYEISRLREVLPIIDQLAYQST